jgi:predicted unusual protein kinase regulating ubiquinone biosynthesis (AarF/ABC1/UbiB family)
MASGWHSLELALFSGVFQEALQNGVANLSFGALSGKLGRTMYQYKFQIPSYYTLLVRSLSMLEGIALSTDPNYKVLPTHPKLRDPPMHTRMHSAMHTHTHLFQDTRTNSHKHARTHTHTHTHTHTFTETQACTQSCTLVHAYFCICTPTQYLSIFFFHTHTHARARVRARTYVSSTYSITDPF